MEESRPCTSTVVGSSGWQTVLASDTVGTVAGRVRATQSALAPLTKLAPSAKPRRRQNISRAALSWLNRKTYINTGKPVGHTGYTTLTLVQTRQPDAS